MMKALKITAIIVLFLQIFPVVTAIFALFMAESIVMGYFAGYLFYIVIIPVCAIVAGIQLLMYSLENE